MNKRWLGGNIESRVKHKTVILKQFGIFWKLNNRQHTIHWRAPIRDLSPNWPYVTFCALTVRRVVVMMSSDEWKMTKMIQRRSKCGRRRGCTSVALGLHLLLDILLHLADLLKVGHHGLQPGLLLGKLGLQLLHNLDLDLGLSCTSVVQNMVPKHFFFIKIPFSFNQRGKYFPLNSCVTSFYLLRWLRNPWKDSHWVSQPAHLQTPWLYRGWLGPGLKRSTLSSFILELWIIITYSFKSF